MDKLLPIIKKTGYGFYLGFILSLLLQSDFTTWQFYIVLVPTVLLVEWKCIDK